MESNCREIAKALSEKLPFPVEYKGVVLTDESAVSLIKAANFDDSAAGIITFCHTFSPSKMWINGLGLLQKPWCHLHTQFNQLIPDTIDMDYMNLHQSAHGDREHGYIGARTGSVRKVIAGDWRSESVVSRLGKWQRACVGAAFSRSLRVVRFGDNMREVAVTDGDKVGAQIQLGWRVNTTPVGDPAAFLSLVASKEGESNWGRFESPEAQSLIEALLVEFDPAKRTELAIKIQQLFLDVDAFSFVTHLNQSLVTKSSVSGLGGHPCDFYLVRPDIDKAE